MSPIACAWAAMPGIIAFSGSRRFSWTSSATTAVRSGSRKGARSIGTGFSLLGESVKWYHFAVTAPSDHQDVTEAPQLQVHYEVEEAVCTITLDNPGRRNAWNPAMEEQYFAALDRAAVDEEVRAIVLTGTGAYFCPGLDSQRLEKAAGPVGLRLAGRRSQHYALTIPKPMIAAINGACAGIGLVQALSLIHI